MNINIELKQKDIDDLKNGIELKPIIVFDDTIPFTLGLRNIDYKQGE